MKSSMAILSVTIVPVSRLKPPGRIPNIHIQKMEPLNYIVVDTKNGLFVECKLIVIYQDVAQPVV
jgi:hypothetical protein